MKIKRKMIDKEYRLMGFFMKILFPAKISAFKRLHKQAMKVKGENIDGFQNEEKFIPSRDKNREIRIRIYRSTTNNTPAPVILYLHGGGYAINLPESDHTIISRFLQKKECIIVAPDYTLSLEKGYPAGLNDSYDTVNWIINNSTELGIDEDKIMLGGVSGGAGLAIALSIFLRDNGGIPISHVFPMYPMIDYRMNSPSMIDNNSPVWSAKHNKIAWDIYLSDLDENEINSYASPSLNKQYEGLPPMSTFVGDLDPFRDEVVEYCKNLQNAGIQVEYKVYSGVYHAFEVVNPGPQKSKDAIAFILEQFDKAVERK